MSAHLRNHATNVLRKIFPGVGRGLRDACHASFLRSPQVGIRRANLSFRRNKRRAWIRKDLGNVSVDVVRHEGRLPS